MPTSMPWPASGTATSDTAGPRSPRPPPRSSARSPPTRSSRCSPTARPRPWPSGSATCPRSRTPRSSSPPAAAPTPSTPRPSWPAPTGARPASPANTEAFSPLVSQVERVPWDDAAALEKLIGQVGADRVAAFFCEPVVGAGGILYPPEGYLTRVQEICREQDVLFVADEVITGFGRLGHWFASERFGLDPDMITCAKGLTSGYAPLGAVLVGPRVAEPFWRPGTAEVFRHGYTYQSHPTACAVGLANLDLLEREQLIGRVAELESV